MKLAGSYMKQYSMSTNFAGLHFMRFSFFTKWILVAICVLFVSACGSTKPYTLGPVKTFDPDNRDIPRPPETNENFRWETLYYTTFYQVEKPLDLGWMFHQAGRLIGVRKPDEAENVNVLDEVPNSSWYTRRHYFESMDSDALKQGPNIVGGPFTADSITVISGKSEGVTPGFTIKDTRGDIYIVKLDNPQFPEMISSSEVISTLIYYASGYFTPQNSVAYLNPKQLVVDENATITQEGIEHTMTETDLGNILANTLKQPDGTIRVLASKYVEGRPLGPWNFIGTLKGDPNDRIPHEDRREVRGLRVLSSWLNDTDRRHGNTIASYVEENGNRYIRHYLLDMGSTLGTGGTDLRHTKRGQAYRYDPRHMAMQYATLGLYVYPWTTEEAKERPFYPSVGYFESQIFDPGRWVTSYPNPAYEKVTPRDGFWGAKLVMAFSDEDIRSIVESGELTNPEAENYLIQILKERRDKIGHYWFSQVNPLDKFEARLDGGKLLLTFADLAVDGGLFEVSESSYRYTISKNGKSLLKDQSTSNTMIEIDLSIMNPEGEIRPEVLKFEIYTVRNGAIDPQKKIEVYLSLEEEPRVVGLVREE